MGRFLLFTFFGRESNRFLLVQSAVQYALFTDRRLVLISYEHTELRDMYDLAALEKHMRAARLELGRAPLPDPELSHLWSWNDYLRGVLKLDPFPTECVAIHRFFCGSAELERGRCAARTATCQERRIPFSGTNGTLIRMPTPTSLQQLQEMPDALLAVSGEWLWTNNLWSMLKQSSLPVQAKPDAEQTTLLKDLYPSLHPTIMRRAGEVIQSLRVTAAAGNHSAVANTTVLALHIRLGDLKGRLSDAATRVKLMLSRALSWGLDPSSSAIFIATDSRDASDHAVMRQSFPAAQIGFPSSLALPSDPPVFAVLLDKAACVHADYFVGSVGSTYSIVIEMLRARLGKLKAHQAMV